MGMVYCIYCFQVPAHLYSGHVLKDGKKEMDRKIKPSAGCFGEWTEAYGIRN